MPGQDGPFLLRMWAAYDSDHAAEIAARKSLLGDIREIENSCGHFLEAAQLLQQAGVRLPSAWTTLQQQECGANGAS